MLKQKVLQSFKREIVKQPCIGIFSKTTDSNFVEAAGYAGLSFIILDIEHGIATQETISNHIRAAILSDLFPIVRVSGVNVHEIGVALDSGALGVQVPNISTAEQAKESIHAAKFHPKGMRGTCRFVRAANFGMIEKQDYFHDANESLVILQVEGVEGVNNLDAILDVSGFDVLFIGPYDLAQSIGKPGQVDSPEVLKLMRNIANKAKEKGVVVGAFSDNVKRNKSLMKEGFNFIACSVDVNIFSMAIHNLIEGKNCE